MGSATLVFKTPTNPMEKEMLHVFLKEFVTARRDKSLQGAPPVAFNATNGVPSLQFSFQKRHQKDMSSCVRMMYSTCDDIDYHIKSSKTYIHNKMSEQCKLWLKQLNTADPTKSEGNKKKKARKSLRN